MHVARDIIVVILLIGGYFFLAAGVLGLLRLPDVYNRMHAMGKCDTLGAGLALLAMVILIEGTSNVVKVLMIMGMILIVSPVMTHLIMRTAYDRKTPMVKGTITLDVYDQKKGKLLKEEGER
ncbi:MAG: monovalent cation/H(+) antiporter subunit G [Firmicutes bacterium]|nr:monovalent cation/H(+) antiporter subunit G [Bacillota bacterium]